MHEIVTFNTMLIAVEFTIACSIQSNHVYF